MYFMGDFYKSNFAPNFLDFYISNSVISLNVLNFFFVSQNFTRICGNWNLNATEIDHEIIYRDSGNGAYRSA